MNLTLDVGKIKFPGMVDSSNRIGDRGTEIVEEVKPLPGEMVK